MMLSNLMDKPRKSFLVCLGLFFFVGNVFVAGVEQVEAATLQTLQNQQATAYTIITTARYNDLFKYYNPVTQQFNNYDTVNKNSTTLTSNGADVRNIFYDPYAISQLSDLVSGIRSGSIALPYYVSANATLHLANIEAAVEDKYPYSKYKALEATMFDKNNPWYNLGWFGSGKLLLNAALTGPMVGLDLVGTGMSTAAKGIWKTGNTIRKVGKIGSKYSKIVKVGGKFGASLTTIGLKLTKLKSSPAIKYLKYFDKSRPEGKALDVILKMLDGNLSPQQLTGYGLNADLIAFEKVLGDDSALHAFVTKLVLKKAMGAIKDELGSAAGSFLIDLYQTGIVNIATAPKVDREFIAGLILDMGLKSSELVPVLGPIMTTVNNNLKAAADINKSARSSIDDFVLFANQRHAERELQLNVYNLLMVEDLLSEIFLVGRTPPVYPNYASQSQFLRTAPSINRIADNIYDISPRKTASQEIYNAYYDCLSAYMQWNKVSSLVPPVYSWVNWPSSFGTTPNASCAIDMGAQLFSVTVDISNQNRAEKKVELYFSLPDRTLQKLAADVAYEDVPLTSSFYREVIELGQRGVVASTGKFYPNTDLTQYEALVMVTNLFYKNQYSAYLQSLVLSKTDQQNRYDFMLGVAGQITPVTGLSALNANASITRGQFAELLMKVIYKKKNAPRALAGASVGTVVQYYDRTCNTTTPNNAINLCTNTLNTSGFSSVTSTDKWVYETIKPSWDVYSTGLKAYGITSGYSGGSYNIINNITRGASAVLLINTFNYIEAHK